jgi:hypothetical protein
MFVFYFLFFFLVDFVIFLFPELSHESSRMGPTFHVTLLMPANQGDNSNSRCTRDPKPHTKNIQILNIPCHSEIQISSLLISSLLMKNGGDEG